MISQSSLAVPLTCKNQFGFLVFKGSLLDLYQGLTTLLSRSRGHKWIQDLLKPYKYPPSSMFKKSKKKKEQKREKNKDKKKIRKMRVITIRNIRLEVQE
jgi:hypothetical protein